MLLLEMYVKKQALFYCRPSDIHAERCELSTDIAYTYT